MLHRGELYTDAKIMLPFWHSIPLFAWFIGLFKKRPVEKNTKFKEEKPKVQKKLEEKQISRKDELKQNALIIEKKLIPSGSTLEKEIENSLNAWNRILNKEARENLTEDVNSLIRDYFRKILRTLKTNTFNIERIENLSKTLANTPSFQKIKEKKELETYIQLYILQIVKKIN